MGLGLPKFVTKPAVSAECAFAPTSFRNCVGTTSAKSSSAKLAAAFSITSSPPRPPLQKPNRRPARRESPRRKPEFPRFHSNAHLNAHSHEEPPSQTSL